MCTHKEDFNGDESLFDMDEKSLIWGTPLDALVLTPSFWPFALGLSLLLSTNSISADAKLQHDDKQTKTQIIPN